jgi:hypothetical protein
MRNAEVCDLDPLWDDDVLVYDEGDPRLEEGLTHNPPQTFERMDLAKKACADVIKGAKKAYGPTVDGKLEKLKTICDLPIIYNSRLRRALARCIFAYDKKTEKHRPVKLDFANDIVWPDDLLFETLVHEYCHAAHGIIAGDYISERAHGPEWKTLMLASGQLPDRQCNDERISRQRQPEYWAQRDKELAEPPRPPGLPSLGDWVSEYEKGEGELGEVFPPPAPRRKKKPTGHLEHKPTGWTVKLPPGVPVPEVLSFYSPDGELAGSVEYEGIEYEDVVDQTGAPTEAVYWLLAQVAARARILKPKAKKPPAPKPPAPKPPAPKPPAPKPPAPKPRPKPRPKPAPKPKPAAPPGNGYGGMSMSKLEGELERLTSALEKGNLSASEDARLSREWDDVVAELGRRGAE